MNLSPDWIPFLTASGFEAVHWSAVGDPKAEDATIMQWARQNGFVVFTHDMDFGTLLALTQASGPKVNQVRTENITPVAIGSRIIENLNRFRRELEQGALIVIDEIRSRVRILPLKI